MGFSGMGALGRTMMKKAAVGGDFLLSNSIARYSTIAAGSAVAAYGYTHDRPWLGTMGAAAAGGVAFGSAYRGYFGPRAQGMARGVVSGARSMYDRMRGNGYRGWQGYSQPQLGYNPGVQGAGFTMR